MVRALSADLCGRKASSPLAERAVRTPDSLLPGWSWVKICGGAGPQGRAAGTDRTRTPRLAVASPIGWQRLAERRVTMRKQIFLATAVMLSLAACGKAEAPAAPETAEAEKSVLADGPAAEIRTVAAADLPPGLRDAVLARVPGMTIAEAERKERDGKILDRKSTRLHSSH